MPHARHLLGSRTFSCLQTEERICPLHFRKLGIMTFFCPQTKGPPSEKNMPHAIHLLGIRTFSCLQTKGRKSPLRRNMSHGHARHRLGIRTPACQAKDICSRQKKTCHMPDPDSESGIFHACKPRDVYAPFRKNTTCQSTAPRGMRPPAKQMNLHLSSGRNQQLETKSAQYLAS